MGRKDLLIGILALLSAGAGAAAKHAPVVDPQAFLDAQNAVRAAVKAPAGYTGTWAPLPPLAWSEEIAATSQQWADHLRDDNKCKLAHSDTRYGENLAMGKDLDIPHAVQLWQNEGKNFRWVPAYEFDIPTGHYSQVVWRKTAKVGCGIATCGHTVVYVCRYDPPGNHIGRAPY